MTHPLHDLTMRELDGRIWSGRGVAELVGLRDVFTDEEIVTGLCEHPCWDMWPTHFQSWVYSAVDAMADEEVMQ